MPAVNSGPRPAEQARKERDQVGSNQRKTTSRRSSPTFGTTRNACRSEDGVS